ncbi:MAG: PPC domain-containing protein [Anaerolineaceae bacterium]|nr:PPC domain-containing protein [Anaerolineaceae bacterium]
MDANKSLTARRGWLIPFLLAVVLMGSVHVQAQDASPLLPFTPVLGEIAAGETQNWTFTGLDGAALSFRVEAVSGDLDPVLSLRNNAGQTLISNDDHEYPVNKDALLEAITLPRTDTYTVQVSGYGDTAGEYLLTLTNGFADLDTQDTFDDGGDWGSAGEATTIEENDGQLNFQLAGVQALDTTINSSADLQTDYYAQVDISIVSQIGGWSAGLTARQQDDGSYYLFSINDRGQWRFSLHLPEEEDKVIRDWVQHPAIVAGTTGFSLGMLVNDTGFDFFYNGQLLGHTVDDMILNSGHIGLALGTGTDLNSQASARFDNLIVTVPVEINGQRLTPQQIILGEPSLLVEELRRRGVIPAAGEMALTVNESFAEFRSPGVSRFMLGRGTLFTDFALGTTVSWESAAEGVTGCGLVFRQSDDTHYLLAYVDQTGGYGLSQRDGDTFLPGIYGEQADSGSGAHQLVLVATSNRVLYYVDGQLVGELAVDSIEGQVGNAVVNFEPISTSCQFTNTWLWRWR